MVWNFGVVVFVGAGSFRAMFMKQPATNAFFTITASTGGTSPLDLDTPKTRAGY
jgi:hypothetical protein